jgi:hypothetical protein
MSRASKGKKKPEGFGEKVSRALRAKGIKPSKEALEKAAESRRGVPPSQKSIDALMSITKGKKQSAEHIEKRMAPIRKKYILTSPLGEEFQVSNINEFCKSNNLLSSKISSVCTGNRTHHKGWRARYA